MRISKGLLLAAACFAAICAVSAPAQASSVAPTSAAARIQPSKDLASFVGTYWYVPERYLLAYVNVGIGKPAQAVTDQTVWHFTKADNGYLLGCSYRSIASGAWSSSAIIGSVAPNNDVSLGFYGKILTIGAGKLMRTEGQWTFLMQVSTGPATNGVTHWAYMMQVKPENPDWTSLPGTKGQSVPSVDTGC